MATPRRPRPIDYPSGDGKPLAETPIHGDVIWSLICFLRNRFAHDPMAYVSGTMLLYYIPGDPRSRVSPDVFVTRGIPDRDREVYLTWEEGKGPDVVIEVTSRTTRNEDLVRKRDLYRDVLRVQEYFLFDPLGGYLAPPLQGLRLVGGEYATIEPVAGRLPSEVLDLHLERQGRELRLFDPAMGAWIPTTDEIIEQARARIEQAEAEERVAEARLQQLEVENERLRREIEALRRRLSGGA